TGQAFSGHGHLFESDVCRHESKQRDLVDLRSLSAHGRDTHGVGASGAKAQLDVSLLGGRTADGTVGLVRPAKPVPGVDRRPWRHGKGPRPANLAHPPTVADV